MITASLYKNDRLLMYGMWEDLVDFVEEIKRMNTDFIDRREFKVILIDGSVIKEWKQK